MKKTFFLFFLFSLAACREKKSNKDLLTGNSVKYWKIIEVKTGKELGYNSFNKDGELLYYFRVHRTGELIRSEQHDIILSNSWDFKGKEIISLNGFDKKILKLTDDTLLVKSVKLGDSLLFLKYEYLHNLSK